MLRQQLQSFHAEVVDKMEGGVCRSRFVCREIKAGQEQRLTAWTRRRILAHAALGRVEDAGVHDDDGT